MSVKNRPTYLSMIEKRFIADNIGPNLECLGRELKLTLTQLTELNDGRQCLLAKALILFCWWEQKYGKYATKQWMIEALNNIQRKDIADELTQTTFETKQNNSSDFTYEQQSHPNMYSEIPQPHGAGSYSSSEEVKEPAETKSFCGIDVGLPEFHQNIPQMNSEIPQSPGIDREYFDVTNDFGNFMSGIGMNILQPNNVGRGFDIGGMKQRSETFCNRYRNLYQ